MGSKEGGSERRQFVCPYDVAFDTAANTYVVEYGNNRVQVMDSNGQFFLQEEDGKLSFPTALHIAVKYVYVSDWSNYRITVYKTSG